MEDSRGSAVDTPFFGQICRHGRVDSPMPNYANTSESVGSNTLSGSSHASSAYQHQRWDNWSESKHAPRSMLHKLDQSRSPRCSQVTSCCPWSWHTFAVKIFLLCMPTSWKILITLASQLLHAHICSKCHSTQPNLKVEEDNI